MSACMISGDMGNPETGASDVYSAANSGSPGLGVILNVSEVVISR